MIDNMELGIPQGLNGESKDYTSQQHSAWLPYKIL